MNSFFKFFFACLLALIVFSVLGFFLLLGFLTALAAPEKQRTGSNAVLVVNLAQPYPEIGVENPFAAFSRDDMYDQPSAYDVVRMIRYAKSDSAVKGILIKCAANANGFGTSEDIRNAILEFKQSGKFVYAYADAISQGAYYVANVADKIYCNPQGGVDWHGYVMQYLFLKGTLDKLEIEPQIFYAGKFKSATEPFRGTKMTDANRLQSTVILNDLYAHFLYQTSEARKIDTATLHGYANDNTIRSAADALRYGLVDGLKYEDQMQDEIKTKLRLGMKDNINFVPLGKYAEAVSFKPYKGEKIAVIYAQGDIVSGKGDRGIIGSDTYVQLIRKARLDKSIKAIVFRINSGGGSAMASENIWRELSLARQEKPVVASYGDVSASGAYYLSCNADSIFAQPNTITGSIGVFSIVPNMQGFFNHKLGVTFDAVKTSQDADALSFAKPMTVAQKRLLQNDVDSIYQTFKTRVAEGRSKEIEYIDSIGQGRIWSGTRALQLGLVDRIGGLQDAIASAARMAKLTEYRLREYPEPQNILDLVFGNYNKNAMTRAMREELGPDGAKTYQAIRRVKSMLGVTQARMAFDISIE